MADVRCPICGEPWELETLHEEVAKRYPNEPWYQKEKPTAFTFQNKQGLWHNQEVYETYFNIVRKEFSRKGCTALTLYGGGHNSNTIDRKKNAIFGAIMEFNGDDIDAAINDIEDAEMFGLLD